MNLIWVEDDAEVGECAAETVLSLVRREPAARLALPTGRTPLGLYAVLRGAAADRALDASRLRIFNLDEFVGLQATHEHSYAGYLQAQFVTPLGIAPDNVRLLDGTAADPAAECAAHELVIAAGGGLDLAILGLGANGHLAFNEPGCDWSAAGRVVELSARTRAAHREGLAANDTAPPELALTIGLPTLLAARAVLLLVGGAAKREALQRLITGAPDPAWPVTALAAHAALTVIAPVALKARR